MTGVHAQPKVTIIRNAPNAVTKALFPDLAAAFPASPENIS